MTALRAYQLLCAALFALSAWVVATGWAPGSPTTETLPASVRDNPSAWRPIYIGGSGYHPVPTSGGGFSYGK